MLITLKLSNVACLLSLVVVVLYIKTLKPVLRLLLLMCHHIVVKCFVSPKKVRVFVWTPQNAVVQRNCFVSGLCYD